MENWLAIAIILAIYFLPTIIAFIRGHASRYAIFILNLMVGWTLIGWFIVIVWASANKGASVTVINTIHNSRDA